MSPSRSSVSTERLHWKDLSLQELEHVLKSEEVTGEPEDYEYIRQDGTLHVLNDECSIEISVSPAKEQPDGSTPVEHKA
ncbi:hypothetical protein MITS9509_01772 [Synechococcus sp. MIT S9509]|uniref:hypothetical protein n=1 Tax=unclassified Synechococcus TaxID=2626047 RepID=UPI0007BC6D07|nr:hypothetical protein [Synechococcus sp. MIT S9509]KZR82852.1 hypothetical protein MITS9504_03426 [Synechococcus sp. MIT S9504]KZR91851.1 hypothetical protein MITS9509_01772 [Synechococcus sp. MIT S9509]